MFNVWPIMLCCAAVSFLYLSHPNQRLLCRRLHGGWACLGAAVAVALAVALWMQAMLPLTGIFVALHVILFVALCLPFLRAWRAGGERR